ncbi:MAG: ATPase domain-containing protein, partial [Methylobacter sp.]
MGHTWQNKLECQLAFCTYLNFAWQSDLVREAAEGLCLPISAILEGRIDRPPLPIEPRNFYSLETFESRLAELGEAGIIYLDQEAGHLLLPRDRRPFAARTNLLRVAERLWSHQLSESKIASAVFTFIRGSDELNATTIESFRAMSATGKKAFRENKPISENDLFGQLRDCCVASELTVRCFIEACVIHGVIYPLRQERNLLTWQGNVDFWVLLAQVFGLHVGIEGLPFLFLGGMPICNPPGNNLLVKGNIGSGKTTLACNISYEVADKGGLSVFLALEQNAQQMMNLFSSFGWCNEAGICFEQVDLLSGANDEQLLGKVHDAQRNRKGMLLLASVPPGDLTDAYDLIDDVIWRFGSKVELYPKLIAIDPVNAIRGVADKETATLRQTSRRLLEKVRKEGFCTLLVAEESSREESFLFEENLCDTVIRLTVSSEEYKRRLLEVQKSRIFPCVRGENRFVIRRGKGIRVYPSGAAYASAKRDRQYVPLGKRTRSGIAGLDGMVGGGLETGTITTLIGDAGTGKS